MLFRDYPGVIIAARLGSPLLIGVGENGETFVGSDAAAVIAQTRDVVYLDDGDMATITKDGYVVHRRGTGPVSRPVNRVDWDLDEVERGGYPHFMLKEIMEQPETLRETMRGRLLEDEGGVKLGGLTGMDEELAQARRKPPEEMVTIVEDLIRLLDDLGEGYRNGRHPDRKAAKPVAQLLRALATELDA